MNRLIAFRNLFAVDREYESISAAVKQGINDVIIRQLQRMKAVELVDAYQKLITSRWIDSFAKTSIENAAWRNGVGTDNSVFYEVAEEVAGDFIVTPRMADVFKKFDPLDGPLQFQQYIGKIVYLHASTKFRTYRNHIKKVEPSGFARMEIPDVPQLDVEEFIADMKEYFYANIDHVTASKLTIEIAKEVFVLYLKGVEREGFEFSPFDVRQRWQTIRKQENRTSNRQAFFDGIKVMKGVLKQFFIEQNRNGNVKFGGRTVAEKVAKAEFRKRLAKWILGE